MKSLILRAYRPALVALGLFCAAVAQAAVPSALTADGVLTSQGGGPVADGNYAVTFVIYKDAAGGAPVWSEGPLQVAVKNGAFSQVLGAVKPVDAGVAAAGGWITLAVGNDPELARKPWRSVPFALRAQVAEGLECSGCIKAAMLDPQTVPAVAKSGNYGDLQGLPTLAKLGTTCGSGLVVKGLKADGSLECVAGLVGGKCAAGQVVTEVKADGSVTCGVVGITGGACQAGQVVTEVKGDGTVVCAPPSIAGGSCQAGQVVTAVKADGSVVCGSDAAIPPPNWLSQLKCRRKEVPVVSPDKVFAALEKQSFSVQVCSDSEFLLGIHSQPMETGNSFSVSMTLPSTIDDSNSWMKVGADSSGKLCEAITATLPGFTAKGYNTIIQGSVVGSVVTGITQNQHVSLSSKSACRLSVTCCGL